MKPIYFIVGLIVMIGQFFTQDRVDCYVANIIDFALFLIYGAILSTFGASVIAILIHELK
jgi:hypothetical protein